MPSYILSKCELSLHCGWACAFSDVQLDQMTCCIGHKRMVFLCCGLACGSPDVLLDQMSYCKLNKCVSFFSVSMCVFICWALPNDLLHRHKHELFLCCGLPCVLSQLLHNRITFDILNTCASCRRAFAILSRFWRGVRPLSTVVFVKLNDLKLSLSIAETFQAFNFVNRPLAIILFSINLLKHLLKMARCILW